MLNRLTSQPTETELLRRCLLTRAALEGAAPMSRREGFEALIEARASYEVDDSKAGIVTVRGSEEVVVFLSSQMGPIPECSCGF